MSDLLEILRKYLWNKHGSQINHETIFKLKEQIDNDINKMSNVELLENLSEALNLYSDD